MQTLDLKPSHAAVRKYYDALNQYGQLSISHENAVKTAFHDLLANCGRKFQWVVVPEWKFKGPKGTTLSVDGALVDSFRLARGYWEAKDEDDNLEREIKKKFEKGYPKKNIIFQEPERAILYQGGIRQGLNEDITDSGNLVELVKHFFAYREPQHEEWETAVAEFSERIPEIAGAVKAIIEKERKGNQKFVASFEGFVALCRQAINPNLSDEAVETMLIQHLLTERIFRKVFNNEQFTKRNIIAAEIEKVIDSLTSKHFSRDAFLHDLNRFYHAIEVNAENATDYTEKQAFLNTVYERFFQGFSKKEADTHGIVYTPQPIVDFMVRSVEDILQKEFGKSLSDEGVHILDPFVGTGNFITRVMKEIKSTKLRQKYENELHCNEIMLLPYYIASMNIEHEYLERMGEYRPFPGICLVDTFDMTKQITGFTAENASRIVKELEQEIFVVIGNPPYNAWQETEDDNNKNRKYKELDKRIAATYGNASAARNKNALSDPYVKAIRWASDRLKREGIIALVTNSGFIESAAADGMRKLLSREFDEIYVLDLGGNVRKNPKLSGTTHNVFGIQVGVCVNLFVRKAVQAEKRQCKVFYARLDEFFRKEQKLDWLGTHPSVFTVDWTALQPDDRGTWLRDGVQDDFNGFTPLRKGIFFLDSSSLKTNRDSWAYNFRKNDLTKNIEKTVAFYESELKRWQARPEDKRQAKIDSFVATNEAAISWSATLKQVLRQEVSIQYSESKLRNAIYRPFTKNYLYFDKNLNERAYEIPFVFPTSMAPNQAIWLKVGPDWPMFALAIDRIPDLMPQGGSRCFPFYTYDEDGTNRCENITDWTLEQFHSHYKDKKITKWEIFHYTYGVLHDAEYRERYAANLKRDLPRIPYAPDFHSYAKAGKRLAKIHAEYEQQEQFKLTERETAKPLNWRVEKMRLSKDKAMLTYNDSLTLSGIPAEVYEYRLGNRSALEWVVDQYQVSEDKRSGIVNDPNREDDPEYIYRLIGQVITVSLETVKIVKSLPGLGLPEKQLSVSSSQ